MAIVTYLKMFVDQEFGSSLAGWFWLKVTIKIWTKSVVIWRLDRSWRGHLLWLNHMAIGRRPQFLARCWQNAQFLMTWAFHKATHDMVAGFSESKWYEREQNQSFDALDDLVSKVTCYHFCFILFIRSKSLISVTVKRRRNQALLIVWGVAMTLWTYFKTSQALHFSEGPLDDEIFEGGQCINNT